MKYKLQIRKIKESDLSVECPFMAEESDFEVYINAFKEDIEALEVVVSVSLFSQCLEIELSSENDFQFLHSSVKGLLTNQYNDKLKSVNGFHQVK